MARPASKRATTADGSQVVDDNLVAQDHVKNATYDLAGRMTGFQVMTTAYLSGLLTVFRAFPGHMLTRSRIPATQA